jgi:hypothetical protein
MRLPETELLDMSETAGTDCLDEKPKADSRGQIQSPDWGDKVHFGIGLPMVNVFESTLEGTKGEVLVNSSGHGGL